MSNLVRHTSFLGSLIPNRAAGNAFASIQTEALLQRAQHEAARSVTVARISDIGIATHHALDAGDGIIRDLACRIEANPLGATGLSGIAEDGVLGVRRELRNLIDGR